MYCAIVYCNCNNIDLSFQIDLDILKPYLFAFLDWYFLVGCHDLHHSAACNNLLGLQAQRAASGTWKWQRIATERSESKLRLTSNMQQTA